MKLSSELVWLSRQTVSLSSECLTGRASFSLFFLLDLVSYIVENEFFDENGLVTIGVLIC